jgi:hypothetical protein
MKNLFALLSLAFFAFVFAPPPDLNAQVCATYCPGQVATANVPAIAGATYQWSITGPEVLPIVGQGNNAITISSVGSTVGSYTISVVVSPPGPLVCTVDTFCTFDVTIPTGVAGLPDICRDAGVVDLAAIATTLTPAGGTFTWTDPVTGLPASGTTTDPAAFSGGNINLVYTVASGACNVVVNTVINIGDPPSILPGIQMG